jgi:hypothetical protein
MLQCTVQQTYLSVMLQRMVHQTLQMIPYLRGDVLPELVHV